MRFPKKAIQQVLNATIKEGFGFSTLASRARSQNDVCTHKTNFLELVGGGDGDGSVMGTGGVGL